MRSENKWALPLPNIVKVQNEQEEGYIEFSFLKYWKKSGCIYMLREILDIDKERVDNSCVFMNS